MDNNCIIWSRVSNLPTSIIDTFQQPLPPWYQLHWVRRTHRLQQLFLLSRQLSSLPLVRFNSDELKEQENFQRESVKTRSCHQMTKQCLWGRNWRMWLWEDSDRMMELFRFVLFFENWVRTMNTIVLNKTSDLISYLENGKYF